MDDEGRYLFLSKCATYERGVLMTNAFITDGDADPSGLKIQPDTLTIVVNFVSTADGRGFSLARHLRNRLNFQGELYAAGKLIPDQVRAAFACGFNAVLVTKEQEVQYGLRHWLDTIGGHDQTYYWASGAVGMRQAWLERALQSG